MAFISILMPCFYSSSPDKKSITDYVSKQLSIDNSEFEAFSITPANSNYLEYAVRLLNSSFSLSNIEEIIHSKESLKVFLDKTFESFKSMVSKINLLEIELKEALSNKQIDTKEAVLNQDLNNSCNIDKIKNLLDTQLENSEMFRVNTERTLSRIKEEYDNILSEFNEIKKLDYNKQVYSNKYYCKDNNCNNLILNISNSEFTKDINKKSQANNYAMYCNNNFYNVYNNTDNTYSKSFGNPLTSRSCINKTEKPLVTSFSKQILNNIDNNSNFNEQNKLKNNNCIFNIENLNNNLSKSYTFDSYVQSSNISKIVKNNDGNLRESNDIFSKTISIPKLNIDLNFNKLKKNTNCSKDNSLSPKLCLETKYNNNLSLSYNKMLNTQLNNIKKGINSINPNLSKPIQIPKLNIKK